MRAFLNQTLILLAVIGLVVAPPVTSGYINLRRAESVWEVGDFSKAAVAYQRSALLLPWQQDLWEQAAMAHSFTGDFNTSISLFERARHHRGLSAEGWDLLGQSYWLIGDRESAVTSWNAGLEVNPSYARFYSHLSKAYFERGDFQNEKFALEQWLATDGDIDASAHFRLGLLTARSDYKRARQEFTLAASLDQGLEPAVETMHAALDLAALETDESRRLIVIGRGLGLVGEWELAAEVYQQAVEMDGLNAEAWAWLGEAEQQLGREGRGNLEKAVSLDPKNPIVRSLRGVYWMRQERADRALAEYLLAAEYDADNPAWQVSIGEAYIMRGDLQSALEAYLRATEMAPTDATYWRLLADFSAQYGVQIEEIGLPAAQMAVEVSGDDPLALDTLGWLLTLLERYDEARDVLEHALSLDPDLASGYLHLGIVALQTDDWQSAKEHFQLARDLDPESPVGEQAQVLLNRYFP
jgi:tetratricopeptide (TPR) repeat protein